MSINNPKFVILHHSLTKDGNTVSMNAIRDYHVNTLGFNDIGYHYIIEMVNSNYEIFVGRMITEVGAHCKQQGMNRQSIGVCFVGNFDISSPQHAMWEIGLKLVRSLIDVFNIQKYNIRGHREFADYKTCPGKMFDVSLFREQL